VAQLADVVEPEERASTSSTTFLTLDRAMPHQGASAKLISEVTHYDADRYVELLEAACKTVLEPFKWATASWKMRRDLSLKAGIKKPHANNNRVERLNRTVRERTKVQRGWKKIGSPLAEGIRIQYNFVKPHMALENQTPAQAAGIGMNSKNKWMEMLKKSLEADTK
jgi:hypothetical protein